MKPFKAKKYPKEVHKYIADLKKLKIFLMLMKFLNILIDCFNCWPLHIFPYSTDPKDKEKRNKWTCGTCYGTFSLTPGKRKKKPLTGLRLCDQQKGREKRYLIREWQISKGDIIYIRMRSIFGLVGWIWGCGCYPVIKKRAHPSQIFILNKLEQLCVWCQTDKSLNKSFSLFFPNSRLVFKNKM